MKNKNFGRKRQAIYILSNRKSTRIIKTLMNFFFFIKVKIKMVCFSVPSFSKGSGKEYIAFKARISLPIFWKNQRCKYKKLYLLYSNLTGKFIGDHTKKTIFISLIKGDDWNRTNPFYIDTYR